MRDFRRPLPRAEERRITSKKIVFTVLMLALILPGMVPAQPDSEGFPAVMGIRERTEYVRQITQKRLDQLLPQFMRQTGFDMWIIACNEDHYDSVFQTMIPYKHWCPITQVLVFYDRGPDKGIERLNVSRSDMEGLHQDAWDYNAWDYNETESQWDCLRRIVHERDPKRIGIHEGQIQWAAGGLTVVLKNRLVEAIGPKYTARLANAEPLVTLWCETLLPEEFEVMEQACAMNHALIAEAFSSKVITPNYTTIDDVRFHYWQRAIDLGLELGYHPAFRIRGRHPETLEKYGKDDKVIRPGDLLYCDVGVKYMHYHTDMAESGYVLRLGETDVPEGLKKLMAEGNRLQDVFCSQFKTGLTGNELLTNILATAKAEGIAKPKIYSHGLGLYLHQTGPLIGLPWEQVGIPGRGDVKLVPNSAFAMELNVTRSIPEWGGQDFRLPLEQNVVFTGDRVVILDGRQTRFHIVR